MSIEKYFGIKELVCPHVYELHGESAWQFLDDRMLANLEFIREGIGKPIIVNNWAKGGQYSQRGLRCCVCALVREKSMLEKPYLSDHVLARGVDFNVQGMTAQEVRDWLELHKEELPYNVRIEKGVNWVHLGNGLLGQTEKISYFYA